jgi:hypothetical protein
MTNEARGDLNVFAVKDENEHVQTMQKFVSLIERAFKHLYAILDKPSCTLAQRVTPYFAAGLLPVDRKRAATLFGLSTSLSTANYLKSAGIKE